MTLQELQNSKAEMLRAPDICPDIIPCIPETLTRIAKQSPDSLPFPVLVMGRYVYFPRVAFLKWIEGNRP